LVGQVLALLVFLVLVGGGLLMRHHYVSAEGSDVESLLVSFYENQAWYWQFSCVLLLLVLVRAVRGTEDTYDDNGMFDGFRIWFVRVCVRVCIVCACVCVCQSAAFLHLCSYTSARHALRTESRPPTGTTSCWSRTRSATSCSSSSRSPAGSTSS
jgi:succinate dehydrogenase hydrophobic anchor subunit